MSKKAIISICSTQDIGEKEKIEVVTVGEFSINGDEFIATYDETEISGMEGTKTTLKIKGDKVVLHREGTTSTKMEFQKNNTQVALYNTPYGMLELKTSTKELDLDVNEKGGNISIKYHLIAGGQEPIKTNLDMKIKVED
ncbi:DUF1934 domain-containing protein [Clostridium perfringens]|uniref:DUF1934 domain-containing protein n=2 Tax=Clostridium perfringens TaxID=1502 RepID=A0A336Q8Y9_CLOPF|nr:DUF1934 domain-containing protein [Clostridium perfringens]ALG49811.1 hypothetical protein FORC3_2434 [Clostridium perfringens]EDT70978.1 conserved hypothetical protein [Clostridium perfringens D str. JGS1721]EGT3599005.1 DUF1934 domain-containing protein [Clostridium perfringens]EHK2388538.1 DUF1934 domain-containing protein [Clostridium perfringens]EHK2404738.1 DUF1934 domain-containing protein [Clostridium perfringens]